MKLLSSLKHQLIEQDDPDEPPRLLLPHVRTLDLSDCPHDYASLRTRLLLASLTVGSPSFQDDDTANEIRDLPQRLPCLAQFAFKTAPASDERQTLRIRSISGMHNPQRLRRLDLRWNSWVTQDVVDRFTMLEELDVTDCYRVCNVHFCASTLLKLAASRTAIRNEGLEQATRLEELHVTDCRNVTSITPFAKSLRVLAAANRSGICDESFASFTKPIPLIALDVEGNRKVTTVAPFAETLRQLNASMDSGICDQGLAEATCLVEAHFGWNKNVTTVAPFAASIRVLNASGWNSGISDMGLSDAHGLVQLSISGNQMITTVEPFAATLRVLQARNTGICDADLAVGLTSPVKNNRNIFYIS